MKKLEIIIRPERLDDLKNILNSNGAHGLMITNIMGYGSQKGHKQVYNGVDFGGNLLPKVKVESIVSDETYENIIDQIIEEINTGVYGDGKIFVYEVTDAIRIRTGERGEDALYYRSLNLQTFFIISKVHYSLSFFIIPYYAFRYFIHKIVQHGIHLIFNIVIIDCI